ncbi:hypothetical protein KEM55_006529 [Ascosphaera atra]|nr:hypothetical protein KEM55_006529 [Ascosphaera atra]
MLSMGFFFDQIQNTSRLVETGVAKPLNKFRFTSDEVYEKACCILRPGAETENVAGGGGASTTTYQRNALRLMRIARVASRRKYHAADLVEEMVYDHELRFSDDGRQLQPTHLQTADMRMPLYKARNWDLYAVCGLSAAGTLGAITFGLLSLWRTREVLAETGRDIFLKTLGSLRTLLPSLSGILESTP